LLGWAPSFLAEDLGYYKDEGLQVQRVFTGTGPAGLTALVSGSGTCLHSAPGELLTAVVRGQKLKILMSESNYQAVHFVISRAYAAKHGITADMSYAQRLTAAKNFKGIRVGVTAPGSFSDFAARAALHAAGLDPAADARVVGVGSVPSAMAAMANGALDAFQGASPAPEMAEKQLGAVVMFSVGKDEIPGYKALSGHLIEARAVDVGRDPDLYAALVRADTRALRFIVENTQAAGEALYQHRYAALAPDVWALVWERNSAQFHSPYASKESIAAWITTGLTPNVSDPNRVNLDEVIDMRFVDQALERIGWTVPT
jgi:ABC-type nitrate/sulfonate/bicarbonate transport system substrate-binding protein